MTGHYSKRVIKKKIFAYLTALIAGLVLTSGGRLVGGESGIGFGIS